jgi:hypothetical protein
MSIEQLKSLAKAGAEVTLRRLRMEIAAIEATFPELSTSRGRARVVATTRRKARTMSAAARKAVSERMRKYWAARKKAEAKK